MNVYKEKQVVKGQSNLT